MGMGIVNKSKDRRLAFWLSFSFVIAGGLILPICSIYGVDISEAKIAYGTAAGFLTTLGVANYFSTPKG